MTPGTMAQPSALRRTALERLQKENSDLNEREWQERRIILSSVPRTFFMQLHAACNADCIFCSKGNGYPLFRLDDYLQRFGRELAPILRQARQVVLSGSGEFLGLPDAERILEYLNREFPHVDKFIATNASHLNPRMRELIAGSGSRYTLQLSLHASDAASHKMMMRYNAFDRVVENIRELLRLRGNSGNPALYFMFVMTTLNVEKLPDFVRFAKSMGADRVRAGYFYIYEAQQKYLSLYFKPELANRYIDEARRVAAEVGIEIELPHKFGQTTAPDPAKDFCQEPWGQFMFSVDGRVLPCDVYGGFEDSLADKSFMEIWNGPRYRAIRRALRDGAGCFRTCPRHNPTGINEWPAHVIHRPKESSQITQEYNEAMAKP